ncbi:MAG: GNAT family N-acetyltransferase, partial [Salinarimonadaceae bacterium]
MRSPTRTRSSSRASIRRVEGPGARYRLRLSARRHLRRFRLSEPVVKIAPSIGLVDAARWDALAQAADDARERDYPFTRHAFLSALEDSGCVGEGTGWRPLHLLVEESERLVAAAPCYLKSNSQGEYVFDHAWADACLRAGIPYYPKLQLSIPFTPATGPRLLASAGPTGDPGRAALIGGLRALREQIGASSIHATFLREEERDAFAGAGFLMRIDQQFHWLDDSYGDYEGFLASLASRKRKAIRRERREALAAGITVEWITGSDLREEHWDAFHAFYQDTGSRKWGRPYLNRRFFSLIGERMPERVLLVMARREGRYVAGALNFIGA